MKIQFNTGRQYSAHGQRIVAVQDLDRVRFHDIDRGIPGYIPTATWVNDMTASELQEFVMFNYDRSNYGGLWSEAVADLVWEEGK